MLVVILLLVVVVVAHADPTPPPHHPNLVTRLPGWDAPLPSKWYSGLVSAGMKDGKTLMHHYVYIESESPDPSKDPVVLWSNGGPGAPSLYGLFVELGPLLLSSDSLKTPQYAQTKIPTLFRNPYSWTTKANLVVINGPPPVGFSYCEPPGPKGEFKSCGSWNDSSTAFHNALAVRGILARHPNLASHDWFFTGESYAGVYIPMLVHELSRSAGAPNIKGMMMGNACMGVDVLCFSPGDVWWRILFLRGHSQLPEEAFAAFAKVCGAEARLSVVSDKCNTLAKQTERLAQGFYEYDVYSECWTSAARTLC
jgi:serine carboxypeptidase-like clade 1